MFFNAPFQTGVVFTRFNRDQLEFVAELIGWDYLRIHFGVTIEAELQSERSLLGGSGLSHPVIIPRQFTTSKAISDTTIIIQPR